MIHTKLNARSLIGAGALICLWGCHTYQPYDLGSQGPMHGAPGLFGGSPDGGGLDAGPGPGGFTGTSIDELLSLVTSGQYQRWRGDPAVHPSSGPHVASGNVRIFMNDQLAGSLSLSSHPIGSIAVMELYDPAGVAIIGHAVSARTSSAWTFLRGFRPTYSPLELDSSSLDGGTSQACAACHRGGVDYVWWRVP